MIISRTVPIAIGSRRVVKKFAIYETIKIGGGCSPNIQYVKLLFQSYYVLEEMSNTNLGAQWYPIEYALTETGFTSPPYENWLDKINNKTVKNTSNNTTQLPNKSITGTSCICDIIIAILYSMKSNNKGNK